MFNGCWYAGLKFSFYVSIPNSAPRTMLKITGNTGNTGNTLVDAIAINWQLATKLAAEPETGNKRLLQTLAAQRCNLLPVTNIFYAHAFDGLYASLRQGIGPALKLHSTGNNEEPPCSSDCLDNPCPVFV